MRIYTRFFISLLSLAGPPAAAHHNSDPWSLNLYFENDLFAESDQNYTNGIRASWVSPDLSSYETDPRIPKWLRQVNDKLHFFHDLRDRKKLSRNLVFSAGQLIYTPADIEARELVKDERPYAGFLYTGIEYHTRSRDQLDTVGVTFGIVGPGAYAREAQDFIHDLRGFDKFQGWDNQLRNEPALQISYEHKHRLFDKPLGRGLAHDLIGHSGINLGNVAAYLNVGVEYRIGWRLPDDFGTSAVRPGGDNSAPGRIDPRLSSSGFSGLHGFISLDTRIVGRDIFLDGNTFKNSHSVDKEVLVADISTGVSFTAGHWKVSYARVFRTREFKKQPHSHNYGSLSVSYSW
ncbi:lipid A deacylase LpxR family protein [Exilibacterium tricleocarpae]|uniref:Lipid A deacylase LpxR family protein n=1 Tax=Exilibacterium tricleocarpae TaxID=2591008 RepID=A0A545T3N2_9GAMM|nr:lipid A deacylase LpxR family protein [Exilibacterium tricleocarpae]TQV71824.1 lipid A deacylase LpxR family protein [Exilibacterium tricleocarpae]